MRIVRIRQMEKFVRALQADDYEVNVIIKEARNSLVLTIHLDKDDAQGIMAQWNDMKKVEG